MSDSRTAQLVALAGAVAVGAGVYVFVGGTAGLLYAAAALAFGLFLLARVKAGREAGEFVPPPDAGLPGGRWLGRGARIAALAEALADERARVAERDTHIEVLRRELEHQRSLARGLERGVRQQVAELDAAHDATLDRVVSWVGELEDELAAVESLVAGLSGRAGSWEAEDSPHGGAILRAGRPITEVRCC